MGSIGFQGKMVIDVKEGGTRGHTHVPHPLTFHPKFYKNIARSLVFIRTFNGIQFILVS